MTDGTARGRGQHVGTDCQHLKKGPNNTIDSWARKGKEGEKTREVCHQGRQCGPGGILLRLGNNRTLSEGTVLLGIVQESSCFTLSARSERILHPRAGCEPGVLNDYRDT